MTEPAAPWSMRSVLVSVRDLATSVSFYCAVLDLHENARLGEVAMLDSDEGAFAMVLREVKARGVRHGHEALGVRAVTFDVGSQARLDTVADRLEAAQALVSRAPLHETEPLPMVTGRDPDGLPLVFFARPGQQPLQADGYRHIALHMYGVDP